MTSVRFMLVTWSSIRDQIGTKPFIKTKEKAYAHVCQLLNIELEKSYTTKQVGDKIKNMFKSFKDKVDNNNQTGRQRLTITADEEAAFGASSSARPEFVLNSVGPGQTFRANREQDVEPVNSDHEDELRSQREIEPAPKKKKFSVAQELYQARVEKQEQFEKYLEQKQMYNQKKLEAYNRRTDILDRFLND